MPFFLLLYLIIALAALVLFAIGYNKNDQYRKIGLILCAAAGIVFAIAWAGIGGGDTGAWTAIGMPLFAAMVPAIFGNLAGGLASYIGKSVRNGLPLGMKVLCVFLLFFGLPGLIGIGRAIIAHELQPAIIGIVFCLIFLLPGGVLLSKWIKK